jgi:hypothetical protein
MSVRSRLTHLASSTAEQQAEELRAQSGAAGADPLRDLVDRTEVVVVGTVHAVTLPPRGNVPALVAELFDGHGSVDLVWLGRRRIAGIRPGVTLRAHGRVSCQGRSTRIYNPVYEIIPA